MDRTMITGFEDWSLTLGCALAAADDPSMTPDQRAVVAFRLLFESLDETRPTWSAVVTAFLHCDAPDAFAARLGCPSGNGRHGLAAIIADAAEQVAEIEDGPLDAAQTALLVGAAVQHLADPKNAPSAEQMVASLRALSRAASESDFRESEAA